MNVKTGTVATQFLFWEYLFRIFGIGSLQCVHCTISKYLVRALMPLPPGSPSQFSVLLAFLVSGSLSSSWVICPFLTPAMLRKFINHVVEATCTIIRETVLLHNSGFCNGDISKQCLHLSVDFLFQKN
jgi:hypothetical protein